MFMITSSNLSPTTYRFALFLHVICSSSNPCPLVILCKGARNIFPNVSSCCDHNTWRKFTLYLDISVLLSLTCAVFQDFKQYYATVNVVTKSNIQVEWANIATEKRRLDLARLDLDAAKSKVRGARTPEAMQQNEQKVIVTCSDITSFCHLFYYVS